MLLPVFNNKETYKFELGKGIELVDGSDVTIIATGLMVYESMVAAEALRLRVSAQESSTYTPLSLLMRKSSSRLLRRPDLS